MADYKRTIPAGGVERINGNGQTYLFCKFAGNRTIRLSLNGEETEISAGSYKEFQPLGGDAGVLLFNDSDTPAAVVLEMGTGTYDEKLVRGEISIEPILRNADGTTKADTRFPVQFDVLPRNLVTTTYSAGDVLAAPIASGQTGGSPLADFVTFGPGNEVWQFAASNNNNYNTQVYDRDTREWLRAEPNYILKFAPGTGVGLEYVPTRGFVYYNSGGAVYDVVPQTGEVDFVSITTLAESGYTLRGLFDDADAGELIGVFTDGSNLKVVFYDRSLVKLREVLGLSTGYGVWSFDAKNRRLVGATTNTTTSYSGELFDLSANQIDTFSLAFGVPENSKNCVEVAGSEIWIANGSNPARVQLRAFEDFTTPTAFRTVRRGCELAAVFDTRKPPAITAALTVTALSTGRVLIQGEVIKAALEWHYGRAAPADYLDHVYSFDTGLDGDGLEFRAQSSGNRTFAAADIEDNFSILVPGNVTITLDNEITFGGTL